MMKVYLDNSFLNRPFDDPAIALHKLEGEVLFWIVQEAAAGRIAIVNSSVIEYENSLNPFRERKKFVEEVLNYASMHQNVDRKTYMRAVDMRAILGIPLVDSFHLALAEQAGVDFFITCDYTLIKKYTGMIQVVTPLLFAYLYENKT